MKLFKKILLILVVTLVLITGFTYMKLFHIGNVLIVDNAVKYVAAFEWTDNHIKLKIITPNSGTAYRGKYYIEGNKLYIKIYEVLVSDFYNSEIEINEDLSEIKYIYLIDNKAEQMIGERVD